MGIVSPDLSAAPPPDGYCPDHGRKPVFGNESTVSEDFSLKLNKTVKILLKFSKIFLMFF